MCSTSNTYIRRSLEPRDERVNQVDCARISMMNHGKSGGLKKEIILRVKEPGFKRDEF